MAVDAKERCSRAHRLVSCPLGARSVHGLGAAFNFARAARSPQRGPSRAYSGGLVRPARAKSRDFDLILNLVHHAVHEEGTSLELRQGRFQRLGGCQKLAVAIELAKATLWIAVDRHKVALLDTRVALAAPAGNTQFFSAEEEDRHGRLLREDPGGLGIDVRVARDLFHGQTVVRHAEGDLISAPDHLELTEAGLQYLVAQEDVVGVRDPHGLLEAREGTFKIDALVHALLKDAKVQERVELQKLQLQCILFTKEALQGSLFLHPLALAKQAKADGIQFPDLGHGIFDAFPGLCSWKLQLQGASNKVADRDFRHGC